MAGLCGSGANQLRMLEDILDGLFHIAKADGVMHEREGTFLRRIAEIFRIDEAHYERIVARHVDLGEADPYVVLGYRPRAPFEEVRRHYAGWSPSNHPDRLIARGLPQEFIAIATTRLAAINAAYEMMEQGAAGGMSGFPSRPSRAPTSGSRRISGRDATGLGPDMIVLHYTGMETGGSGRGAGCAIR